MSPRDRSDIVECDEGLVIKLYSSGVPREEVEEEIRLTRIARDQGILAPVILDLVQDTNRWGYSYEKVNGSTYMDLIADKGADIESLAFSFAFLHRTINARTEERLPSMKARLIDSIRDGAISEELKEEACRAVDRLPEGRWFCHGDFHPGNVIVTDRGDRVLDWVDSASGHFLADVARTLILLEVWLPLKFDEMGIEVPAENIMLFRDHYRASYLELSGENGDVLDKWLLPIAVARLCRAVPSEERDLRDYIEKVLST
jgi:tRNA A-37 threonylcarbamoyl transferase component Bud32